MGKKANKKKDVREAEGERQGAGNGSQEVAGSSSQGIGDASSKPNPPQPQRRTRQTVSQQQEGERKQGGESSLQQTQKKQQRGESSQQQQIAAPSKSSPELTRSPQSWKPQEMDEISSKNAKKHRQHGEKSEQEAEEFKSKEKLGTPEKPMILRSGLSICTPKKGRQEPIQEEQRGESSQQQKQMASSPKSNPKPTRSQLEKPQEMGEISAQSAKQQHQLGEESKQYIEELETKEKVSTPEKPMKLRSGLSICTPKKGKQGPTRKEQQIGESSQPLKQMAPPPKSNPKPTQSQLQKPQEMAAISSQSAKQQQQHGEMSKQGVEELEPKEKVSSLEKPTILRNALSVCTPKKRKEEPTQEVQQRGEYPQEQKLMATPPKLSPKPAYSELRKLLEMGEISSQNTKQQQQLGEGSKQDVIVLELKEKVSTPETPKKLETSLLKCTPKKDKEEPAQEEQRKGESLQQLKEMATPPKPSPKLTQLQLQEPQEMCEISSHSAKQQHQLGEESKQDVEELEPKEKLCTPEKPTILRTVLSICTPNKEKEEPAQEEQRRGESAQQLKQMVTPPKSSPKPTQEPQEMCEISSHSAKQQHQLGEGSKQDVIVLELKEKVSTPEKPMKLRSGLSICTPKKGKHEPTQTEELRDESSQEQKLMATPPKSSPKPTPPQLQKPQEMCEISSHSAKQQHQHEEESKQDLEVLEPKEKVSIPEKPMKLRSGISICTPKKRKQEPTQEVQQRGENPQQQKLMATPPKLNPKPTQSQLQKPQEMGEISSQSAKQQQQLGQKSKQDVEELEAKEKLCTPEKPTILRTALLKCTPKKEKEEPVQEVQQRRENPQQQKLMATPPKLNPKPTQSQLQKPQEMGEISSQSAKQQQQLGQKSKQDVEELEPKEKLCTPEKPTILRTALLKCTPKKEKEEPVQEVQQRREEYVQQQKLMATPPKSSPKPAYPELRKLLEMGEISSQNGKQQQQLGQKPKQDIEELEAKEKLCTPEKPTILPTALLKCTPKKEKEESAQEEQRRGESSQQLKQIATPPKSSPKPTQPQLQEPQEMCEISSHSAKQQHQPGEESKQDLEVLEPKEKLGTPEKPMKLRSGLTISTPKKSKHEPIRKEQQIGESSQQLKQMAPRPKSNPKPTQSQLQKLQEMDEISSQSAKQQQQLGEKLKQDLEELEPKEKLSTPKKPMRLRTALSSCTPKKGKEEPTQEVQQRGECPQQQKLMATPSKSNPKPTQAQLQKPHEMGEVSSQSAKQQQHLGEKSKQDVEELEPKEKLSTPEKPMKLRSGLSICTPKKVKQEPTQEVEQRGEYPQQQKLMATPPKSNPKPTQAQLQKPQEMGEISSQSAKQQQQLGQKSKQDVEELEPKEKLCTPEIPTILRTALLKCTPKKEKEEPAQEEQQRGEYLQQQKLMATPPKLSPKPAYPELRKLLEMGKISSHSAKQQHQPGEESKQDLEVLEPKEKLGTPEKHIISRTALSSCTPKKGKEEPIQEVQQIGESSQQLKQMAPTPKSNPKPLQSQLQEPQEMGEISSQSAKHQQQLKEKSKQDVEELGPIEKVCSPEQTPRRILYPWNIAQTKSPPWCSRLHKSRVKTTENVKTPEKEKTPEKVKSPEKVKTPEEVKLTKIEQKTPGRRIITTAKSPGRRPKSPKRKSSPLKVWAEQRNSPELVLQPILGKSPEQIETKHDADEFTAIEDTAMSELIPWVSITPRKQAQKEELRKEWKEIVVKTNHLELTLNMPSKAIYHYEVSITPEKLHHLSSQALEKVRENFYPSRYPAFDGKKNLYCYITPLFEDKEFRQSVNVIDEGTNQESNVTVVIKPVATVDSATIDKYFSEKVGDSSKSEESSKGVSESSKDAIQAIDIVIRQPTLHMFIPVKRSFFNEPETQRALGGSVDMLSAMVGWKPLQDIDVARKDIPTHGNCITILAKIAGIEESAVKNHRFTEKNWQQFSTFVKRIKIEYQMPKMCNRQFIKRTHKIKDITTSAIDTSFIFVDPKTNESVKITVQEYYLKQYRYEIKYPKLRCLLSGSLKKPVTLPLELCSIPKGRATIRKMNESQTREMINLTAVNTDFLKRNKDTISNDPQLKEFIVSTEDSHTKVKARVIEPPVINYSDFKIQADNGVWPSQKFSETTMINNNWAILKTTAVVNNEETTIMADAFIKYSELCGMKISAPKGIAQLSEMGAIKSFFNDCKKNNLDFVIVIIPFPPKNDQRTYGEIKKCAETEYGIITQCLKENTVKNRLVTKSPCISTYINILQKINSKLNGKNHYLNAKSRPHFLVDPFMIVGADVTHPSPDDKKMPSIAAVAASYDFDIWKYNIVWKPQQTRAEVIEKLENIIYNLLVKFKNANQKLPHRIIFYRGGVSEGQFETVWQMELKAIRKACTSMNNNYEPAITFLIVQKRHRTRFFPVKNENTGGKIHNVPVGTVVDSGITHPIEPEFYIMSHATAQGTPRPTRYHLVWDDGNLPEEELKQLTYNLCHLFTRCSKSVSYPAPTYYAHLAAYRARLYFRREKPMKELLANIDKQVMMEVDQELLEKQVKRLNTGENPFMKKDEMLFGVNNELLDKHPMYFV